MLKNGPKNDRSILKNRGWADATIFEIVHRSIELSIPNDRFLSPCDRRLGKR